MTTRLFTLILGLLLPIAPSWAQTPPSPGEGNGMERGGGDAYAQEFVAIARELERNITDWNHLGVTEVADFPLAAFQQAVTETVVSSQDHLYLRRHGHRDEVDAINYPRRKRIEVSRSRWDQLTQLADARESRRRKRLLVLHEYIDILPGFLARGAAEVDDGDDYQISGPVVTRLERQEDLNQFRTAAESRLTTEGEAYINAFWENLRVLRAALTPVQATTDYRICTRVERAASERARIDACLSFANQFAAALSGWREASALEREERTARYRQAEAALRSYLEELQVFAPTDAYFLGELHHTLVQEFNRLNREATLATEAFNRGHDAACPQRSMVDSVPCVFNRVYSFMLEEGPRAIAARQAELRAVLNRLLGELSAYGNATHAP